MASSDSTGVGRNMEVESLDAPLDSPGCREVGATGAGVVGSTTGWGAGAGAGIVGAAATVGRAAIGAAFAAEQFCAVAVGSAVPPKRIQKLPFSSPSTLTRMT